MNLIDAIYFKSEFDPLICFNEIYIELSHGDISDEGAQLLSEAQAYLIDKVKEIDSLIDETHHYDFKSKNISLNKKVHFIDMSFLMFVISATKSKS